MPATGAGGYALVTRHQAFWIDSKSMGRIWLGLTDSATGGINGINLANTAAAANMKPSLLAGGFLLRSSTGALTGVKWSDVMGQNGMSNGLGEESRTNVIKYVSPTLAGFIFSAAWGEDDFWDVALRYAGEFSGFKIAAGIGYAQTSDGNGDRFGGCAKVAGAPDRDCSSINVGASLMHVPTGLFASGHYATLDDDNVTPSAGRTGDDFNWHVQAGLEQNWTGLGKTTLFGEYGQHEGNVKANDGILGIAAADPAFALGGTLHSSEVTIWGLGVVQSIDAAALDLYLAYRNYSTDLTLDNGTAAVGAQDFQVISAGGLIKF